MLQPDFIEITHIIAMPENVGSTKFNKHKRVATWNVNAITEFDRELMNDLYERQAFNQFEQVMCFGWFYMCRNLC